MPEGVGQFTIDLVLIEILRCAEFERNRALQALGLFRMFVRCRPGTKRSEPIYFILTQDPCVEKILGCEKFEENWTFISHFRKVIIIPKVDFLRGRYLREWADISDFAT